MRGRSASFSATFSAAEDRSGPIKLAQVWENGFFWANSFESGTTKQLVVKIGLTPNLQNAKDVNDPIVTCVTGGSRNQSLTASPHHPRERAASKTNLWEELAFGCSPDYTVNTGTLCPSRASELWASPKPWDCVAVQTGGATNQVPRGPNLRILGDEKPTTCTAPPGASSRTSCPAIRGAQRLHHPLRVVQRVGQWRRPGNQAGHVLRDRLDRQRRRLQEPPVRATVTIRPWRGGPPNIVGHFIKYIFGLNDGGGSGETCDFDSFGSCIAVLTE